jgi:hypothetical protein
VAAGCTEFNLIPQSPGPHQAVAGVAAVRNLLAYPASTPQAPASQAASAPRISP